MARCLMWRCCSVMNVVVVQLFTIRWSIRGLGAVLLLSYRVSWLRSSFPLIAGRVLASHLKGRCGDLVIVNVHMPNTSDPVAMYR
eukprot:657782-Pyramimonas_sp.AAC.1